MVSSILTGIYGSFLLSYAMSTNAPGYSHFFPEEWRKMSQFAQGLEKSTVCNRQTVFGANVIDIPQPSTFNLLLHEVLHPFNVFQAFSVVLWFCYDYVSYAVCILLITVFSIVTTLRDTKKVRCLLIAMKQTINRNF
jgi:hypothetical protein